MIAIGVTGHRKLLNEELLLSGVDRALINIKDSFPNPEIIIISPLAEGADRLVARRAMANYDADLVVPLPLVVSEYMKDFPSESSKAEFTDLLEQAQQVIELPPMEDRETSYLAAGLYVLKHSDVLVAIWDGQPARGPAGTGQIVSRAREQKKPLAWIFAGSQDQDYFPAPLSELKQEEVEYENFPSAN